LSTLCIVHQWSHATEPCPYCREINSTRHARRRQAHHHEPSSAPSAPELSPDARAERLSEAILAGISGDVSKVEELFTSDVVGSGPVLSVSSREELALEFEEREGTFTDVEVALAPLDVAGDQACVEWVASGVETGSLAIEESRMGVLAPTGRRIRVRAVTVAEFDGDQICSFRSYWDDVPVLQEVREMRPS
jgi:ketosteroid isomerase-like protein